MKTEKALTKRERAKIWKAVLHAVDRVEFDDLAGTAAGVGPGVSWTYGAYVARCVIAVRDMARKAKQPK